MKRTNRAVTNSSYKDTPFIEKEDLMEVAEGKFDTFLMKMDKLIGSFNVFTKSVSLSKNFSYNSSIVEVSFLAGETKVISHFLGVKPNYRIILRQEGNGVLSDIPSRWNEKVAVIINNGAVTVKATIMFLKE